MTMLEHFTTTVKTLTKHGNFDELCDYLSQSNTLLARNSLHLDSAVENLDLKAHTLGYLAILGAKITQQTIPDWNALFCQIQDFITNCNEEQIRYAPHSFAELCHCLVSKLIEKCIPIQGISLLCTAITKIQCGTGELTSIHADIFQLCLSAKCFKPALQFLDREISQISKESGFFDVKYLLLHYYYGGMIYLAMKNLERAHYFFEIVITTPAFAISHIMVEAYKKYILVSLLTGLYCEDKNQMLPKFAPQVVNRCIKGLCLPYIEIMQAFKSNNTDELESKITLHHDTFLQDQNMGLVQQVHKSLFKSNIKRLTKTFITLSLTDMSQRVRLTSPSEAEKQLLEMIEQKNIFAKISHKDGMVRFDCNPECYDTKSMQKLLEASIERCMQLDQQLINMDEEIMCNMQYIKKSNNCSGRDDEDGGNSSGHLSRSASTTNNSISAGSSKIPNNSM